MKLGAETKLGKGRTKTSKKKISDEVMSTNYDVIVIFPIYNRFGAIRKPDFERIVYKSSFFFNSGLSFTKNWKQN